jgi:hypothetical protein
VNRRDLEWHLRSHGCELDHHGSRHDIWTNPANKKTAPVPRHTTIKRDMVRIICRQLDVPLPAGI